QQPGASPPVVLPPCRDGRSTSPPTQTATGRTTPGRPGPPASRAPTQRRSRSPPVVLARRGRTPTVRPARADQQAAPRRLTTGAGERGPRSDVRFTLTGDHESPPFSSGTAITNPPGSSRISEGTSIL